METGGNFHSFDYFGISLLIDFSHPSNVVLSA